jgi:transcriptional regulator with XRE-family HTH domain
MRPAKPWEANPWVALRVSFHVCIKRNLLTNCDSGAQASDKVPNTARSAVSGAYRPGLPGTVLGASRRLPRFVRQPYKILRVQQTVHEETMERNIRLNWEAITQEARRQRKARGMTQLRLAALAKVSRSTVVRFESNIGDIQLSSALRILSVLDMVEGKQEGNLLLRREGQTLDGPIVVMFAPYMGPGGAMEPRRFRGLQDLAPFLKELKIDPAAQRLAIADLERTETATVPNILLTMAELHEFWPIQFSEKSRGGA